MTPLLEVIGLTIEFPRATGAFRAVRGVDLAIQRGETVCIVGESGCGKSLTSLGIVGLLPAAARREAGAIRFDGRDLLRASQRELRDIRGDRIGMVFQNPMTSLNPTMRIGAQMTEPLLRHRRVTGREASERAVRLLERVGIAGAAERLRHYPHQLSGGQRQRVMIAMALMCEPDLLIADEPTTALDVTIQAQILRLLGELGRESGRAMIMITHDLGLVSRIADRVVVMYAGEVVEQGLVADIFLQPKHPYTAALLASIPKPGITVRRTHLQTIPGTVPTGPGLGAGCAFADRCRFTQQQCLAGPISLRDAGNGHTARCVLSAGALKTRA